jgi:hypothetical protein
MNQEEILNRMNMMQAEIEELKAWKLAREAQQLIDPIDDTSRIVFGMGVAGETADTTPAKAVLVNTNVGQLKVLVA